MYINFSDLFSTRGERTVAKHQVQIKNMVIPPGVSLKGLDLQRYAGKLLHVELRNDVYVIRGYYTYHPFAEGGHR